MQRGCYFGHKNTVVYEGPHQISDDVLFYAKYFFFKTNLNSNKNLFGIQKMQAKKLVSKVH